ncbi:MAG TPA: hypothetical protein VGI39_10830, partial [Polyangiaceae bacterium]
MAGRLSGWVGLAGVVALGTVVLGAPEALAQVAATPPAAPPPSAAPAAPAAPAAATPPAAAPAAPAGDANANAAAAGGAAAASTPAASNGNVTGYGYSKKSPVPSAAAGPARHRPPLAHHANEAVATFDGFEMLADGGSRVFVQLSKQVDV